MEEKEKLKLLQKKYNISDKELIAIGLKQEETTNESTKVSNKEKEMIQQICLINDVTVSKYIRDSIMNLLECSMSERKKVAADIKKQEKEKKNRPMETTVPYVLTKNCKKELLKFCKQNKILNKSSIARYIITEAIRGGEEDDILSKQL